MLGRRMQPIAAIVRVRRRSAGRCCESRVRVRVVYDRSAVGRAPRDDAS